MKRLNKKSILALTVIISISLLFAICYFSFSDKYLSNRTPLHITMFISLCFVAVYVVWDVAQISKMINQNRKDGKKDNYRL
ncbi:MAG: hypothetical protein J5590_08545 [Clostridia bacterium]|nr:hypothetical protein [Clostridia bacterium]